MWGASEHVTAERILDWRYLMKNMCVGLGKLCMLDVLAPSPTPGWATFCFVWGRQFRLSVSS